MLKWIEEFQVFVEQDPAVLGSIGLPQVMSELGEAYGTQSGWADPVEEINRTEVRTEQDIDDLLSLAELEDDHVLWDVYLPDEGVGQVIVLVQDQGSPALSPLTARVEERLQSHPPPTGQATATGTVKLTTFSGSNFFPVSSRYRLLYWCGSHCHGCRSVSRIASRRPQLIPLVLLLGLMGLGGFDLKPLTSLLCDRFWNRRRRYHPLPWSPCSKPKVLRSSPRCPSPDDTRGRPALVLVTVVVVAGFSSLMFSAPGSFLIGFTASAAVLALFADQLDSQQYSTCCTPSSRTIVNC